MTEPAAEPGLHQMVPEAGLEPAQGCPRGILSPLRLPIPPLRHAECDSPLPRCSRQEACSSD
jgi:hypothetical protein